VKIKQDILDNINATSKEALDFLNQKQNDINNQEGILLKTETAIVKNLGQEGMTDTQRETIEALKQELKSVEFNEADIMKEQLFMSKLMQEIEKAMGTYNMPYSISIIRLQEEQDKYLNFSGVLEERFNAIKEENADKQSLRQKIVYNESKLSKAKEKYESFTKNFAPIHDSIKERDDKKAITEEAKQELILKLQELQNQVSELKSKLEVAHEKNVDLSIALKNAEKEKEELEEANALFQNTTLDVMDKDEEVTSIKDEIDSIDNNSDEIEALQLEIDQLNITISQKDREIDTLESEKAWLLQQNVSQGVEIGDLKNKLRVWESNYNTFKNQVIELANYVGYPLGNDKLNANGDGGSNPLIPLIGQLEDITAWVKEQEELIPEPVTEEVIVEVEKEHSHLGYIIGGALLTALALTFKK
jgi:chromosome segregation ATPase